MRALTCALLLIQLHRELQQKQSGERRDKGVAAANDRAAATAESEMTQHAGDTGEWLGIDCGAPSTQVTLPGNSNGQAGLLFHCCPSLVTTR